MTRLMMALLLMAGCSGVIAQVPSLDDVRRLVREGQLDEAMTAIDVRLAANPTDRNTRFLKGVVLAETQQADAAIDVFTTLTDDYPDLPEPYNNLAVLYAAKGDFEAAREALLKAINTHPSYATAHENLGDIYAKMAGLAYSRALSLDTANATAKHKLALIDDLFTREIPAPLVVARAPAEPLPPPPPAVASPPPRRAVTSPAPSPARKQDIRPVPAAPVTPPAPPAETREAAIDVVRSWAAAWSRQDVDAYLDHYLAGRSPEPGLSRAAWEAQRRVRLKRPAFIELRLDDFRVQPVGESVLTVTFVQAYRSNTYADRVRKRLTLVRSGQSWKIGEERSLAKL